ncbi:hypothetical protein DB347_09105 [Opitutaceae bacterium EW11]|nr:hypothetical protein DB347_09105 [Opitutaceae bacterium EW11]
MLWGIAPGPAGLVAVGTGGTILQSLDGQSWTARDSGTQTWWLSCAYGNGNYVAVGDRGEVLTSADGATWTPQRHGQTNARLNRVAYGGGKFVAVGEAETILTSDDGVHWLLTHGGGTNWLRGLVCLSVDNSNVWLATGQNGVAYLSTDARTWTVTTGVLGADLEVLQYQGQQFISSKGYPSKAGWFYLLAAGANETVRELTLSAGVRDGVVSVGDLTASAPNTVWNGSGARLRAIVGFPGTDRFQLFGENGVVLNGSARVGASTATWSEQTLPVAQNSADATNYAGRRYVVGDDLRILESEPPEPVRFSNLSTRAEVGTGEQVMIAGAIVSGSEKKRVLIRALGPTLTDYGLVNVLPDPRIEIFQGPVRVAEVGAWSERPDADTIRAALTQVGAPPLDPARRDAAAVLELPAGATTFVVSSVSNRSGVALVDVFDLEPRRTEAGRLFNLSTRGLAGPGEQTMIAGLMIDGPRPKTVIIRGLGAKLAEYGIARPLEDPVLTLYRGGLVVNSNDDWTAPESLPSMFGGSATAEELRTMMKTVGLSSLDNYPKEAVIAATLAPGVYTVHLSGKSGASGTALIEAFELPY